jgi:YVTN family beta-propeller protein
MAQVVNTIPVNTPSSIVQIENEIWVTDEGNNRVTVINTITSIRINISVGIRPVCIISDNTYVWVTNFDSDTVSQIEISSKTVTATIPAGRGPLGITGNSTYIWVANFKDNKVTQILKANPTSTKSVNVGTNPYFISNNINSVWVANYGSNSITQIDINNFNTATPYTPYTISLQYTPVGITASNIDLWITNGNNNSVSRYYINGPKAGWGITDTIPVGNNPYFITQNSYHIWVVNNSASGTVTQILKTSKTVINTISVGSQPTYASLSFVGSPDINNYKLWVANSASNTVSEISPPTPTPTPTPTPIICFKEDTKILTNKGYLPIQDLQKGDLVKTLKNDYVPIDMIGKKEIYHFASEERIKDQLYKCSKEEYPEVFEDLVLTGCHCILVDEFKSEEEKEKTIEVNGDIYITDNKYRLPACVDKKTKVYENKGNHTIYHFALENNDYYMNYGVFANGLLVETTSKRFMKELSGMKLIE